MDRPERDSIRAADYVLGLMEPNEAAFFERDMRNDRALARQVADWRARVAMLDDAADTPQAEMRRRIIAGLTGERHGVGRHPSPSRSALALAAAALAGLLLVLLIKTWS